MVGTELNFPNPVLTRSDLIARDRELAKIEMALGTPTALRPVVIQGERVIGKTSLLNVALEWAEQQSGYAVLPLPHVRHRDALIEEILDGMAARARTTLTKLGLRSATGTLTVSSLNGFVQVAADLVTRAGTPFLLSLDELDSMLLDCPEPHAEAIIDLIQYLVHQPTLAVRFVCTLTRTITQILGSDASHFMQSARIVELTPWTAAEGRGFVESLLPNGPALDDAAHAALYGFGGGHPYFTKAVLQAVFDDPATATEVSADDVHRAAATAATWPEVAFTVHNIVTRHFTDLQRAMLFRSAVAPAGLAAPTDPAAVAETDQLVRRGYLRPEQGSYLPAFGLVSAWIRRQPAQFGPVLDGVPPDAQGTSNQTHAAEPAAMPDSPVLPMLLVDLDRRRIFLGATEIDPSPQGYRFLECLVLHRTKVVDRDTLAAAIWPDEHRHGIGDARLDAVVHRLRDLLGANGSRYIETKRGRGWMVNLELLEVIEPSDPS